MFFFPWGILEKQLSKSRSILVTRRFDCLPWSSLIKLFHLLFAWLKVVGSRKSNRKIDIGDSCMGICDEIEVETLGINKTTILTQYYKATITLPFRSSSATLDVRCNYQKVCFHTCGFFYFQGHPTIAFTLNTLKRLFRLSRVILDI